MIPRPSAATTLTLTQKPNGTAFRLRCQALRAEFHRHSKSRLRCDPDGQVGARGGVVADKRLEVRVGGDLPGGLDHHLSIVPRIEESNQEGANIRKGTEAVETSFSLTNSLLTVVDRPVREM